MRSIRRGDTGPAIVEIRAALQSLQLIPGGEAAPDPRDPAAQVYDATCELGVRAFQQSRGLVADGVVDSDTYRSLIEARYRLGDRILHFTPARLMRGDDVAQLQERLLELGYNPGRVDSILGEATARALASFQRDSGLAADATCGPETLRAFAQLGRKVTGGSPLRLRQRTEVLTSGPALIGRRITLDAQPVSTEPSPQESLRAELAWDIANRTEGRLRIMGAAPTLTRGRDGQPDVAERTTLANDTRAELLVCIDVAVHDNPAVQGLATFYYGTPTGIGSHVGEELAGLLHRELCTRTGMTDLAVHTRQSELLRLTRMPAVVIELGYLTNPADRELLLDDRLRDTVAEGIVAAIQRFYLAEDADFATGTWTIPPELRA